MGDRNYWISEYQQVSITKALHQMLKSHSSNDESNELRNIGTMGSELISLRPVHQIGIAGDINSSCIIPFLKDKRKIRKQIVVCCNIIHITTYYIAF